MEYLQFNRAFQVALRRNLFYVIVFSVLALFFLGGFNGFFLFLAFGLFYITSQAMWLSRDLLCTYEDKANQKMCGNATINSAAHSNNDFCFHRIKNNQLATEGTENTELQ